MGAPGFWDEPETAQKTAQAVTQLKEEVETFRSLETRVEDMEVLCELALEEDDESLLPEMEETLVSIRTDVEHLELGMLLNGEYDANNAILTLHAGAGGTEAQDWTSMLLRMFSRFAEREGYEVEMLDYLPGDEAGVKSATLQINGHNAYGYLRSERVYIVWCVFLRLMRMPAGILLSPRWMLCRNWMTALQLTSILQI